MRIVLPALVLLLAAGSTLLTTGCSTTDRMRDARPTPPPGPDEAKVIVYRTSLFGESAHFPVYEILDDGGRLLGFTETDRYFEITCPPGLHLFLTWNEGEEYVVADLEPGKTYYLKAYSKFGLAFPRPGLVPVERDSEAWKDLEKAWPTLRCRELDPREAHEFTARHQDRLREAHRSYVEGTRAPRVIRPDKGAGESDLPAK